MRSFLSAHLKGRTSHQQDTSTNTPIRGRHHLGTGGRLILGIAGRHHFGIRGRHASEFARLLLEVDHRTKNVLAIVDSVVRLSRSDNAASYSASVQQRVQALSRTHVLLADKGWQEVELEDIIRAQIQVFEDGNVEVAGPAIMVPAPSAQPIGLAIHELAANAVLHGALAKGGKLHISWVRTGSSVTLTWRERGPVVPIKQPERGFGNVLLSAVIEKQLGGRITREWRDEGLLLTIEFPPLDRVGGELRGRP